MSGYNEHFFVYFTCVIFKGEVCFIGKTDFPQVNPVKQHYICTLVSAALMNLFLISVSIPAMLLSASYQFLYLSYEVACYLYFSAVFSFPSLVLEQVYYRFTCHLFCQIYFPFAVHHHNHHPISTGTLALSGLLTTSILSQLLALLKQLREQDIV
jgi:hypothetical protein